MPLARNDDIVEILAGGLERVGIELSLLGQDALILVAVHNQHRHLQAGNGV